MMASLLVIASLAKYLFDLNDWDSTPDVFTLICHPVFVESGSIIWLQLLKICDLLDLRWI